RSSRELARDLELEESEMADKEDGQTLEEDVDVEIDGMESMSEEEKAQLRATCRPVKFMLVKLRKLAFKVINSTTKLLPAWLACLKAHGLPDSLIPRDVSTRWNSTHDMADYCVDHIKPLKAFLADEENDLEAFELTAQQWRCTKQLRQVLKASLLTSASFPRIGTYCHHQTMPPSTTFHELKECRTRKTSVFLLVR
ncbi:hypothetical protein FB107DRAFT_224964, partial [Schizophyllum commune]